MKNMETLPWKEVETSLNTRGMALLGNVLSPEECDELKALYDQELFRKTIQMARYRFGSGEYKYFSYPLPNLVSEIRSTFYHNLVPVANLWMKTLKTDITYPEDHQKFIEYCHAHGQNHPTPLLLKYQQGDYNTLHQDLYGEVYFPFQAILFLSQPRKNYEGGELVLTEQVPRAQSRASVFTPGLGDIMIITTQFKPERGSRGYYRKNMRHGVSEVAWGLRYTLGVIFHDAA